MTARKLPMPGVRDRKIGGHQEEGEEFAAAALRGGVHRPHPQQRQQQQGRSSENGLSIAAAEVGQQGNRCSINSSSSSPSQQAGLASSNIMQPLPLASRYVPGTATHDTLRPTASSALGSSWIRRFLPSTEELGQEMARVPPTAVWGGSGGAGGEPGTEPVCPLLLASGSDEQKEQQEATGMTNQPMGLLCSEEKSFRVSGNGEYIMQKGKAPPERENESWQRGQTTTTAIQQHDLGQVGVRASLRKFDTLLPSHHAPGTYGVEGSTKLQQHEGGIKHRTTVQSTHRGGEFHHANGTSGAMVTGFGPLRVVMKPVARSENRVVGGSGPRLPGMEGETQMEADFPAVPAQAQPDAHRLSNATSSSPDRKPSGTQAIAASQTGTKYTPLSKSRPLEDPSSGRPFRAVESAGTWGFLRPKKQEVESDFGGRLSFMKPPKKDGARDNTTTSVAGGGLKLAQPVQSARLNLFGEAASLKHRMETGNQTKFLDHESGIERMKTGSGKFSERFVSSYPLAQFGNVGKEEDGGRATENLFHSRVAAEDTSARPNFGAGVGVGAGFPTGVENRKMKEVVGCGFSSRRHTETGPSQQQHSMEVPPYASYHPFQGDMCIGKAGHPLPFSPHSSFPGEDNSGEDIKKSPLTTLFGAPKAYEDGLDGRAAAPSEQQQAPWTSLFAAFKGHEYHLEPANSTSSTPTLRDDVHSRLQDGSSNRPFEIPKVNGIHAETSGRGGRGRNNDHLPASPESRSRFDNQGQSSHFSSSPWPDDEGHIRNDDAGSGPYNSQATGSGPYRSQASRVANTRSSVESKGKYVSIHRYDTGGGDGEGFDTPARSRGSSATEPDLRKFAGSQGEDEGHEMSNEGSQQAHVLSTPPLKHSPTHVFSSPPLKHSLTPPVPGHPDDTSDSSPPSYPQGYNSSEMGSPVVPWGIVDEHLLSTAGKLKNAEVDLEMEGSRVPRMRKGYGNEAVGILPKRRKDSEAVDREDRDVSAFLSKDPDLQGAQPITVRVVNHEQVSRLGRPNAGLDPGLRHGKSRMSGEAMGEVGISGPSKRTRHGSTNVASQMAGSAVPSSWLQRWLPPSSGNVAKSPAGFARPKDKPRNSFTYGPSMSNGNAKVIGGLLHDPDTQTKIAEGARRKKVEKGNEVKLRINGVKDISGRGLNCLPPHAVPSAAAMALAGAATRKIGRFPQQRKGSVAMWPPVHLQTAQAPAEGQQSSRSPELSL